MAIPAAQGHHCAGQECKHNLADVQNIIKR